MEAGDSPCGGLLNPLPGYLEETKRLYGVLEIRLANRDWLAGPGRGKVSIADLNVIPWVRIHKYAGVESIDEFPNVKVGCLLRVQSSFLNLSSGVVGTHLGKTRCSGWNCGPASFVVTRVVLSKYCCTKKDLNFLFCYKNVNVQSIMHYGRLLNTIQIRLCT